MSTSARQREPVSIVCVFNDPDVRISCLDASIDAGRESAPDTEFVPVDNRERQFASAGAALNHAATLARNRVVVFVHQDVALHSLPRLEAAAHLLMTDPDLAMVGAVGIDAKGRIIGRMRDRVVQIGENAPSPRDIDTLDEVLFMMTREQVLAEPLSEDPLLSWHAYAVEYACRIRRAGRRATAMDLDITHNSLTVNLDRLDVAHRRVGELYPELLPLHTTCGTIHRADAAAGIGRVLRRSRGARTWWRESQDARAVARGGAGSVVLADIRLSIDDAVGVGGCETLRVLDVVPGTHVGGLTRFGRAYAIEHVPLAGVGAAVRARPAEEAILVTGFARGDAARLGLEGIPHVLGHWRDIGWWALVGVDPATVTHVWGGARSRPFAGLLPGSPPRAATR